MVIGATCLYGFYGTHTLPNSSTLSLSVAHSHSLKPKHTHTLSRLIRPISGEKTTVLYNDLIHIEGGHSSTRLMTLGEGCGTEGGGEARTKASCVTAAAVSLSDAPRRREVALVHTVAEVARIDADFVLREAGKQAGEADVVLERHLRREAGGCSSCGLSTAPLSHGPQPLTAHTHEQRASPTHEHLADERPCAACVHTIKAEALNPCLHRVKAGGTHPRV
jgi:hypothetical protein